MKFIRAVSVVGLGLCSIGLQAAVIDGHIAPQGGGEYRYSTEGGEGSAKWDTFRGGDNLGSQEYNDASGGEEWDIQYMGTDIQEGKFQFGAIGGHILSGEDGVEGEGYTLSDFAISVGDHTDPTKDSSGFEYAVRLLDVNNQTGIANFSLLTGGFWDGIEDPNTPNSRHVTDTQKMLNGQTIANFSGKWTARSGGSAWNVLEAEFDLSLLSLLNTSVSSTIHTYLSMSCVNDEVLVETDVAAVPVPAAVWLFGSALMGLAGMRRKKALVVEAV